MKVKFTLLTLLYLNQIFCESKLNNSFTEKNESTITAPLTVYSRENLVGTSADIPIKVIFRGDTIPNGLNNKIRSFVLRAGHMATFANNFNGTGKSKVYIARTADLTVNVLPEALKSNISFIRVMPWVNSPKKGTGYLYTGLNTGWYYNWGSVGYNTATNEYVPMTWGGSSTRASTFNPILAKDTVTHILGFNEADACDGQSGQYNGLCKPDTAVAYFENIMASGLRIGSVAPRENGPQSWLRSFDSIAKAKDVRFDFVAVHWYDWGAQFPNTSTSPGWRVFERFKAYLTNVYNYYQLPIWITEFNANPRRDSSIQAEFLSLALPYLDSLPYVERYAYFEPNIVDGFPLSNMGYRSYYYPDGVTKTPIGNIYSNHVSNLAISAANLECPNNLLDMDKPVLEGHEFEAENAKRFGSFAASNIPTNAKASNRKQVSIPLGTQNHIVFDSVVIPTTGKYRLTLSYLMPGNSRKLKLKVNGIDLGDLNIERSSLGWHFDDVGLNNFADFSTSIDLVAGLDSIQFRSVSSSNPAGLTPHLDKISLLRENSWYEAENATKTGTSTEETCSKSSNGKAVDLKTTPSNALSFDVNVANSGQYYLDVAYFASAKTYATISVNGATPKRDTFYFSGDACTAAGVPRVKTVLVSLNAGNNTISLSPAGSTAIFIDKIAILNGEQVSIGSENFNQLTDALSAVLPGETIDVNGPVYPSISSFPGEINIPFSNTVKLNNTASWINLLKLINDGTIKINGGIFENGATGLYQGVGTFEGTLINKGSIDVSSSHTIKN